MPLDMFEPKCDELEVKECKWRHVRLRPPAYRPNMGLVSFTFRLEETPEQTRMSQKVTFVLLCSDLAGDLFMQPI